MLVLFAALGGAIVSSVLLLISEKKLVSSATLRGQPTLKP